jgi:predicted lipid-binding transport protein (Tim44 family)
MSDPVTIGGFAAMALAMASEAAFKSAVGEAVKGAYSALKQKVSSWASSDVEALEKAPTSKARQDLIAEEIDRQAPDDRKEVRDLARALLDELEKWQSSTPIGIDIGKLKAARVKLGEINVSEGIGFRAKEIDTPGDFETQKIIVGDQSGKSQR